jgi:hypothetical protein
LTACGTERVVEKPVIVEVVKTEWREVPADLTARCAKSEIPEAMTYGEALESWAKDRASIDACNGKLAGIESLGVDE